MSTLVPESQQQAPPSFKYQHLGSMASVGEWKGVFDSPSFSVDDTSHGPPVQALLAFLL